MHMYICMCIHVYIIYVYYTHVDIMISVYDRTDMLASSPPGASSAAVSSRSRFVRSLHMYCMADWIAYFRNQGFWAAHHVLSSSSNPRPCFPKSRTSSSFHYSRYRTRRPFILKLGDDKVCGHWMRARLVNREVPWRHSRSGRPMIVL